MTFLKTFELDLGHDVVDFLAAQESPDLTTCDREPIHLSGAIQPHGVLIAVGEDDLRIRHISANCAQQTGSAPDDLLGMPLATAIGIGVCERLAVALRDPRASGLEPLVCHLLTGIPANLTWHRMDRLVVIELEPDVEVTPGASMSGLFADVRSTLQALEEAHGLQELCEVTAREVQRLTGYDRVMMYRFHSDEHGEVIAEACRPDQEPFLGLHYPASDIPRQARKLFLLNRLRMIADVGYDSVPVISEVGSTSLNLSLSALRSVSPMHLEYLSNMGVAATLTISIMHGNRLWGMLACHHLSARTLDPQLRAACRVIGQVASMQIVAQGDQETHAYRSKQADIELALVARLSDASSLAGALIADDASPLALTAAEGMVARINGETVTSGVVPPAAAIAAVLAYARGQDETEMVICDDAPNRLPNFTGFAAQASGILGVSLSGIYDDFIFWFRGEMIQQVRWGGDPDNAVIVSPGGTADVLSPRRSFDVWSEEVRGRGTPWLQVEIDAAREFGGVVPKLLLARARDRLAHLAIHDELTGLPNRTLLLDRAAVALARHKRTGVEVALLFVDLDRFKFVNDSLGHAAGDELLRQAAARLSTVVRDADTVSRIGGDEFIVLCEGTTVGGAHQLAHRVVVAFRKPFRLGEDEVRVTASVGVTVAAQGATPAELIRDADTAMYRAKHSGRDNFSSVTSEMRAVTLRRVEMETKLRPALQRRELSLYFQPVHTCTGVLTGFEALSRWPLHDRGMVPPIEFIAVAEAIDLIDPLTLWVLDDGLHALARWRKKRPELNLNLAVNITAAQVKTNHLEPAIDHLLRRYGLPPTALTLEITESALVTDEPSSVRFFRSMRLKGVRLSIDDFGTGFSSLAYLTKLPVHELKIDRAFITGLPTNKADLAVVASVVALAHQLGLEALAEGVENDDQLATVRRLGCDRVQGYLLGRPMPAEEIDRFLGDPPTLAPS